MEIREEIKMYVNELQLCIFFQGFMDHYIRGYNINNPNVGHGIYNSLFLIEIENKALNIFLKNLGDFRY